MNVALLVLSGVVIAALTTSILAAAESELRATPSSAPLRPLKRSLLLSTTFTGACAASSAGSRLVRRSPKSASKKRIEVNDPSFKLSWVINGEKPDASLNVRSVWSEKIDGEGVVVGIVDFGADLKNKDLAHAAIKSLSYDFVSDAALPDSPANAKENHGTRSAGVVVAEAGNSFCGVGVAPRAKFASLRVLGKNENKGAKADRSRDVIESQALSHKRESIHIYSMSWGPDDNGRTAGKPGPLLMKALRDGVALGRGGLGSIFIFASGNGRDVGDECNYDGYVNSIYTFGVAAITYGNDGALYSEECPMVMISTYSTIDRSDKNTGIVTADNGVEGCTQKFDGTSASAPFVAGVVALMLEAQPKLTWRDVMHIIASNAVSVNPDDPTWQRTQRAKISYSPRFGFGRADASKLVGAAKTWVPIPGTMAEFIGRPVSSKMEMKPGQAVRSQFAINNDDTSVAVARIEQVRVKVSLITPVLGELIVKITSPSGSESVLTYGRPNDKTPATEKRPFEWEFGSLRFWGDDNVKGSWFLEISSRNKSLSATLVSWQLKLYGMAASDVKELDGNSKYTQQRGTIDSQAFTSSLPSNARPDIIESSYAARNSPFILFCASVALLTHFIHF